jgi:hypothetical protein
MSTGDLLSVASSLFDRWRHYLSLRDEGEALVRLSAIECRRNLGLLSALRLDETASQSDPDFPAVAELLETSALEALFAVGPAEKRARELLSQTPEAEGEDKEPDLPAELLLRIYVRITAMQKLLTLVRAGKGLRDLRWRTRLLNLKSDLRQAVGLLDSTLRARK